MTRRYRSGFEAPMPSLPGDARWPKGCEEPMPSLPGDARWPKGCEEPTPSLPGDARWPKGCEEPTPSTRKPALSKDAPLVETSWLNAAPQTADLSTIRGQCR
jgi:hypothetical protein